MVIGVLSAQEKIASQMREFQIVVGSRQGEPGCVAQSEGASSDLLVVRQGGRTGKWRRRNQGKAVRQHLRLQITLQRPRPISGWNSGTVPSLVRASFAQPVNRLNAKTPANRRQGMSGGDEWLSLSPHGLFVFVLSELAGRSPFLGMCGPAGLSQFP